MADLRFSGVLMKTVRSLALAPVTSKLVWSGVSKDFRIDELRSLPADQRGNVEEVCRPVQAAPPRSWGGGKDLDPPKSSRCTAATLRAAYESGETTPVDVLERLLARIDARDFGEARFSPFVEVDRDGATKAAEASAERWKKGEPLGPLDGVPVPVKDEFDVAGFPSRGGTTFLTDPAAEDAWVVGRLRDAGALVVGKTHATEYGLNPLGYSEHYDFPHNVYASDKGAGGSSTGSGVAVGLGLSTVALGADGGCSIRIPATMNGVFGIKPSFTRIGRTGDIWVGTVGTAGPIGRSTDDCVSLLEVCAALDPNDPITAFADDWDTVIPTWRKALGRGIEGCRIGVLQKELDEADGPIGRLCREALSRLESEGAVLVDVDIALASWCNAVGAIVIAGESAANTYDVRQRFGHRLSAELMTIYGLVENLTGPEVLMGSRVRTALRRQTAAALADVDLLALPIQERVAPPYALDEGRKPLMDSAWTAAMTRFNFLANLTGLPAGAVPVGMHAGHPVSLQLVGDAWDEASVLAAMAHCERIGLSEVDLPPAYASLLG